MEKTKYRIHMAPSPEALQQAARVGSNMAVVYSVGPCSHLTFPPDPVSGRGMDEFPIYFPDYPKVSELRRNLDGVWIEPLRQRLQSTCRQSLALGMKPVFHLYEPMLPLSFEVEYPELVKVWKRPTQDGTQEKHTLLDPDNPETWRLMKAKYRELAEAFPDVAMFIITTGDTASAFWCVPDAKMPVHERLAMMYRSALEGIEEAGTGAVPCCRLWWRNFPAEYYRDGHRLTAETTGVENAAELMNPMGRRHNDPEEVLPKLFAALPKGVPIMYKSTRMDIVENSPATFGAGSYPREIDQIIEISYENYNKKPWPWCKVDHIRRGLDLVKEHKLKGYLSLPINMGNNTTELDPEKGNLGRMNTWLLEKLAAEDPRSDRELIAEWLEKEFGGRQPEVVLDALMEADVIADDGVQWGRGIRHRVPFASLHTTKLYWCFDGFIQPDFPYKMADPDREQIESMIALKHEAYERASRHVNALFAARASIAPALYAEIHEGYRTFADFILLRRDWASYLLMQLAIEKGVYPPERNVLGRMSRYVERFIRNMIRLKDTTAGKLAMNKVSFPDNFPLS